MFDGLYRASVYDVEDPENRGRLRLLIPQALGPNPSGWAEPTLQTTGPQYRVGDLMWVLFEGGDVNRPTFFSRPKVSRADLTDDVTDPLDDVVPTEPPDSVTVRVSGTANGLIIETSEIANTTTLEYHLSTTAGFTPGPDTLSVETTSPIYVTNQLPNGVSLVLGSTYYVQVIAKNIVGSAAPSPEVSGALNADNIRTLVADQLVVGFILTGKIQVGAIFIDAANGVTIPQPGGRLIKFPVDGTAALIQAFINATGLVVDEQADFKGLARILNILEAANGISTPTDKPTLSYSNDYKAISPSFPSRNFGICDDNAGANWIVPISLFGGAFQVVDKTSGNQILAPSMPTDFYPDGGITRIGTSYYVLGSDAARSGNWYVYIFNSSFTKTGEWAYTYDANASSRRPAIGRTSAGNILIVRSNTVSTQNRITIREFNPSTGATVGSAKVIVLGTAPVDCSGVYYGNTDIGSARYFVASDSGGGSITAVDASVVYQPNDSFTRAGSGLLRGLFWDGTRFQHINDNNQVWSYATGHPSTSTGYAAYTWFDDDASVGIRHETAMSPEASFTWPARTKMVISATLAPQYAVTDPAQTDKANIIRFYARTSGSLLYQGSNASAVGEPTLTIEGITAGGTWGSYSDFSLVTGAAGVLRSEKKVVGNPTWWLSGDGTGHLPFGDWDATGNIIGEITTTGLPYTNSGGTTFTDFDSTLVSGYELGTYSKTAKGVVTVRGVAKRTAGGGSFVATLPASCQPSRIVQRVVGVTSGTGIVRVYPVGHLNAGKIELVSGTLANGTGSLFMDFSYNV